MMVELRLKLRGEPLTVQFGSSRDRVFVFLGKQGRGRAARVGPRVDIRIDSESDHSSCSVTNG